VSSRISCIPRTDATPDSSRAAVARCYAYLIERQRLRKQKVCGPATAPEKTRGESKHDSRAPTILHD
jgi:hypothetical protein